MAHDVPNHAPQVLLVIPMFPVELTDPKLNGSFALSGNPMEIFVIHVQRPSRPQVPALLRP